MLYQQMKQVFNLNKPMDISQETWDEYVESGRRKRFWQLYGIKTVAVTIFVTFGLNLILNESLDVILHKPGCHSPLLSFSTIIVGAVCITVAIVLVFAIDRNEEYNRLKHEEIERQKKDEREQEKAEIISELKDFIKTECSEPK